MAALAHLRLLSFSASRSNLRKWGLKSWRSAKSLITLKSQSRIRRGKSAISSAVQAYTQGRNSLIIFSFFRNKEEVVILRHLGKFHSIRRGRDRIWYRRNRPIPTCTNSACGRVHNRNSMFRFDCCKSRRKEECNNNVEKCLIMRNRKDTMRRGSFSSGQYCMQTHSATPFSLTLHSFPAPQCFLAQRLSLRAASSSTKTSMASWMSFSSTGSFSSVLLIVFLGLR